MYNHTYTIYNKILLSYADFYDMYIPLAMLYYVEIFFEFSYAYIFIENCVLYISLELLRCRKKYEPLTKTFMSIIVIFY